MFLPRWLTEARGLRADLIAGLAGAFAHSRFPRWLFYRAVGCLSHIAWVDKCWPIECKRRSGEDGVRFWLPLIGLYWITEASPVRGGTVLVAGSPRGAGAGAVLAVFIAVPVWLPG